MTLEQRVEALEKRAKSLMGEFFEINEGQVFIKNAAIKSGSINAACIQTAIVKKHRAE